MNAYYATYHTLTRAQRARKALRDNGILCSLVRTPKGISEGGCGWALRLSEGDFSRARPLLQGASRLFWQRGSDWQAMTP